MTTTKEQASVLNNKEAMAVIITEAKKAIAKKFNTTVNVVEMAISAKNENVMSMMRQFVSTGINAVVELKTV